MIRSLISGFSGTSFSWIKTILDSSYAVNTIHYNGNTFICYSGGNVYMSTDGITWVKKTTNIEPFHAYCTTYTTNTFIMGGMISTTSLPAIYTSPDGITWTSRSTTGFGSSAYIKDICWSGTYLVAVSDEGHIATSSATGSTWTQRAKTNAQFTGVAFGGGIYVAVGTSTVWTSTNGTTWTDRSRSLSAYGIAYGAGKFVTVGNKGKIYTSLDGITWTQRTSPFGTTQINNIDYNDGRFVAVDSVGKIATSIDGITWVLLESPIATILEEVAYGSGKIVAVGGMGVVITSQTEL